jgi:hypothetical protein
MLARRALAVLFALALTACGGSAFENAPNQGSSGSSGSSGAAGSGGVSGAGASAGSGGAAGSGGIAAGGAGGIAAGGSGGTSGSGGGGGVGGIGPGDGGNVCPGLAAEVEAKLALAKRCSLLADAGLQCQKSVDGVCCPVVVGSPTSETTTNYLLALKNYKDKCTYACPAIACALNPTGTCTASTSGSRLPSCN